MSTIAPKVEITPEDLLKMPDGDRYELVDGNLVERDMSLRSSYIGARLSHIIISYCDEHPQGWVMGADCGYQCFPDNPNLVRKPDISFIRLGRMPLEEPPEGHIRFAPDLVVEVLSPDDIAYETDRKVEEYLAAGVRLVWVINPDTRTVLIYRGDGTIGGLREHDELSGEEAIPGFRCRVEALFVTPAAVSG